MRKILFIQVSAILLLVSVACVSFSVKPTTQVIPTIPATQIVKIEPTNIVIATAPVASLPKLDGDWRIFLTQSGGIMGMSTSVEILSSGAVTVTNQRTKESKQSKLSVDQLKTLMDLVANTAYQPVTQPSGCADCYIFDLEITSGNQKFQAGMNQIDLQNSGLEGLISFLGVFIKSIPT